MRYVYPKLREARRKAAKIAPGITINSSDRFPYKLVADLGDKRVHFGDRRYEDFLIHKDRERRARYRKRHAGDRINDMRYPGFWSWNILW